MPPDVTVADFEVVLGVVVVVVAVPCDDPDEEELVPDGVAVVEVAVPAVAVVSAVVVVPGISLDTMSPSAAAAPVARMATVLDVRCTRALATSRRAAPARSVGPGCVVGRPSRPVVRSTAASPYGVVFGHLHMTTGTSTPSHSELGVCCESSASRACSWAVGLRRPRERETDREHGAATCARGGGDGASVGLRDRRHDGKTQAGATVAP